MVLLYFSYTQIEISTYLRLQAPLRKIMERTSASLKTKLALSRLKLTLKCLVSTADSKNEKLAKKHEIYRKSHLKTEKIGTSIRK